MKRQGLADIGSNPLHRLTIFCNTIYRFLSSETAPLYPIFAGLSAVTLPHKAKDTFTPGPQQCLSF